MSKGFVDKGTRRQKASASTRASERQERDTRSAMLVGLPGVGKRQDQRRWSRMTKKDRELSMALIRFTSVPKREY